jgi:polysaccharide biosynthesis protein PelA
VLDSQYHPPLKPLKTQQKILLGYISLGEITQENPFFETAQKKGISLHENKNWPGSYFVDLRNPAWLEYIVNTAIPNVINQGFDGIFLDTIDTAEYLETLDPKKYSGLKRAAINLLHLIRLNYPYIKIMLNRGFPLLPQ